jgi:hypothetical protein
MAQEYPVNYAIAENKRLDMGSADMDILHKNQMLETIRELFNEDKLFMISDLTRDEIKLCTRIHGIAVLKNIPEWDELLESYVKFLLSHRRESRREIIKAIAGLNSKKTLGERLNPANWGRGD